MDISNRISNGIAAIVGAVLLTLAAVVVIGLLGGHERTGAAHYARPS